MLSCIPVEESSGSRSTAEGYRHDRARIDHHLAVLDEAVPGRCTTLDQHRSNRGGGLPDWPEWCLLPMAGPYAICKTADLVDLQRAERGPAAPMAALYAWRQGRSIYRFDPDLTSILGAAESGKAAVLLMTGRVKPLQRLGFLQNGSWWGVGDQLT